MKLTLNLEKVKLACKHQPTTVKSRCLLYVLNTNLNVPQLPEGSVNGELNLLSPVSINPQVSKFTSLSARAPPVRQSHTEVKYAFYFTLYKILSIM